MKSEFENYMRKFNDRYFVRKDEDRIYIIAGKYGKIAPCDPAKGLLGVWCINLPTKLKKTYMLKRLSSVLINVHQDCDQEFGAYFHERDIEIVAKVIKAKHRCKREFSEKQKQAIAARGRLYRESKKNALLNTETLTKTDELPSMLSFIFPTPQHK
jgi:hypothetical protein